MHKIAVVTPDAGRDWASNELLRSAKRLATGGLVNPLDFELHVDGSAYIAIHGGPIDRYDAYIMRGFNRQGEIDYQYEILELLEEQGKLVINSPAGLSLAESKAETTFCLQKAGLPVPRTIVTQHLETAERAALEFGTAVVKPLYGSFGIGIERLAPGMTDELLPAFLDKHGVVCVQEYVPNEGRDIRAFVVGDEMVAAIYRIASEGQWKTNVFQGGRCEACELSPALRELCLEAARTIGLDYTGVDIMEGPGGPMILELNGAPLWQGLHEATGRDIALDVVTHVLRMLDEGRSARQPAGFPAR